MDKIPNYAGKLQASLEDLEAEAQREDSQHRGELPTYNQPIEGLKQEIVAKIRRYAVMQMQATAETMQELHQFMLDRNNAAREDCRVIMQQIAEESRRAQRTHNPASLVYAPDSRWYSPYGDLILYPPNIPAYMGGLPPNDAAGILHKDSHYICEEFAKYGKCDYFRGCRFVHLYRANSNINTIIIKMGRPDSVLTRTVHRDVL